MAHDLAVRWGRTLKRLRKAQGLSLTNITDATGLHRSTYCRIEAGDITPGDETRMKIARAVGARVEEIFDYPDIGETETTAERAD